MKEVNTVPSANPAGTFPYNIKPGDTLFNLSKQYNISVERILSANQGLDPDNLTVGQTINMPARRPLAVADVRGGPLRPQISGVVSFYEVTGGTWVCAEVNGLPPYQPADGANPIGPHGFHIHESGNCQVGDPQDPFKAAGEHWNPTNQPHGNHAGDFPVLFSNGGYANTCFFTNRFTPDQVIGKSVLIHQNPDDYRTQPAGDSGRRLACGVIQRA